MTEKSLRPAQPSKALPFSAVPAEPRKKATKVATSQIIEKLHQSIPNTPPVVELMRQTDRY